MTENEDRWAIIILAVAFVIYATVTYTEKDAIYGGLFLYILIAIKAKQQHLAHQIFIFQCAYTAVYLGIVALNYYSQKNAENGLQKV